MENPFNDWTNDQVMQGFSWRKNSVSFRTLQEMGMHYIDIYLGDHVGELLAGVQRAIEVPFEVPRDGAIDLASIGASIPLQLPAGRYLLRCEFFRLVEGSTPKVRLSFGSKDAPHFAVPYTDESLHIDKLVTDAQPAIN